MRDLVCHVLRGLPGSGKSTYVSALGPKTVVCSADSYFVGSDGVYVFDSTKLSHAHGACWSQFERAVSRHTPVVAVDNTNVRRRDFMPYVEHALERGYDVVLAEATERDIDVLMARGLHGVPRATYERMTTRWQEYVPDAITAARVTVVKF